MKYINRSYYTESLVIAGNRYKYKLFVNFRKSGCKKATSFVLLFIERDSPQIFNPWLYGKDSYKYKLYVNNRKLMSKNRSTGVLLFQKTHSINPYVISAKICLSFKLSVNFKNLACKITTSFVLLYTRAESCSAKLNTEGGENLHGYTSL